MEKFVGGEGKKGRLFRRKDGKYLLYVSKGLAEDSMFPFRLAEGGGEEEAHQ